MHNCGGTHFAVAPLTFSPIAGTPGGAAAAAGTEYVGVYSAIAVSACIDIVCKRVTDITKDVWAIDCQLSELEDFLSEIKDELVFLSHGVIALVHNAGLLDIKWVDAS